MTFTKTTAAAADTPAGFAERGSGRVTDAAAAFAVLCASAAHTLDTHLNDAGRCVVCGGRWPCELALLAERNLAWL